MSVFKFFGLLLLVAVASRGTAQAGIIYSGPLNAQVTTSQAQTLDFSAGLPGISIGAVTFSVQPGDGFANVTDRQIQINGGSGNDFVGVAGVLTNLPVDTDVDASSGFISGIGNLILHRTYNPVGGTAYEGPFVSSGGDELEGFIGMRLVNSADPLNPEFLYGWIHYRADNVTVENPSGTILGWAFRTDGSGIPAGLTAVPEPSSLLLVGGLVGLGFVRRRR